MNSYIPYYSFFTENEKIIKDVRTDFTAERLSGGEFDKSYNAFLHKFLSRCQKFATESSFRGQSKLVSQYVSEIAETEHLQAVRRFEKLLEITESYKRQSM